MCSRSSSDVISLFSIKAIVALMISVRLCGGIFVAIPTAIPDAPLTRRFGILVGRTVGSSSESSKLSWKSTVFFSISASVSSAIFLSLASV